MFASPMKGASSDGACATMRGAPPSREADDGSSRRTALDSASSSGNVVRRGGMSEMDG